LLYCYKCFFSVSPNQLVRSLSKWPWPRRKVKGWECTSVSLTRKMACILSTSVFTRPWKMCRSASPKTGNIWGAHLSYCQVNNNRAFFHWYRKGPYLGPLFWEKIMWKVAWWENKNLDCKSNFLGKMHDFYY